MKDQALYDRLVSNVKVDEASGCWNWTAYVHKNRPHPGNRYGGTSIWDPLRKKQRTMHAHRAMMFAVHGPLTPQQCVCHKCDNPLCVNPDHLFIGSMKDNIWDSRRKGRHYESRRDHCERGHPLSGSNLRYYPSSKARHCMACARGRSRVLAGWPEDLAYSEPPVPHGYSVKKGNWSFQKRLGHNGT